MMIHFQRDSKGMFRFILSILFILAIPIILSSVLSCRISVEGEPYHQGPGPRPAGFPGFEGPWSIIANNQPGQLEFYLAGGRWAGRIWFDVWQQWENLIDIIFDPRTGYLEFTRPSAVPAETQRWSGTLTHNQIVGTYLWRGSTFSWHGRRP